jgi:hypothetical protein
MKVTASRTRKVQAIVTSILVHTKKTNGRWGQHNQLDDNDIGDIDDDVYNDDDGGGAVVEQAWNLEGEYDKDSGQLGDADDTMLVAYDEEEVELEINSLLFPIAIHLQSKHNIS